MPSIEKYLIFIYFSNRIYVYNFRTIPYSKMYEQSKTIIHAVYIQQEKEYFMKKLI